MTPGPRGRTDHAVKTDRILSGRGGKQQLYRGGGNVISSTISMNAIRELDLAVGKEAYAVIKATSVMVGIDE